LKEHQDLLISQLNPLVDQINVLENRVNALNTENMIGDAREQLEQWRLDSHEKIDQFFKRKSYQLIQCANKKVDKQRQDVEFMRTKLTELINEHEVTRQDVDALKNNINDLENQMNKTEQASFQIQIHSGDINENLIFIEESNPSQFDLSSLPLQSKTIKCSKENWAALATNEKHLLMYKKPNLCLVNQDCTILKKALWSFGEIWDMFWSPMLERFIVINKNTVFLIDEPTMTIESIQMVAKQNWCCGTCSDKSLYLATYNRGSSIVEFNLLPSIEYVKQWKCPDTCSKDEGIHDMIYNDEKLFLIIENQVKKTVRVELRSSITLDCLWSLPLDSATNQKVQIRCCLLNNDEWIVAYHDLYRLLHISNDGKLKASCSYTPAPHFASTFGSNLLVVATSNSVNLHQL
jgi:hypothetical protein